MKAYLAVTAILFGGITAVHVSRMFVETRLLTQPTFLLLTLVSGLLCVWGAWLFAGARRAPR